MWKFSCCGISTRSLEIVYEQKYIILELIKISYNTRLYDTQYNIYDT